jgi:hypothetical protein
MIYHFNVHDGTSYADALGTERFTLNEARIEAVTRMAGYLPNSPLGSGRGMSGPWKSLTMTRRVSTFTA